MTLQSIASFCLNKLTTPSGLSWSPFLGSIAHHRYVCATISTSERVDKGRTHSVRDDLWEWTWRTEPDTPHQVYYSSSQFLKPHWDWYSKESWKECVADFRKSPHHNEEVELYDAFVQINPLDYDNHRSWLHQAAGERTCQACTAMRIHWIHAHYAFVCSDSSENLNLSTLRFLGSWMLDAFKV